MTNDIEGKVSKSTEPKSLEDRIMNSNIPKSESEWWAKKEIEKLREQILSLTTKPLDEKEVFKLIDDNITDDVHEDYQGNMLEEKKALAKLICSHFSKQIKYPEKKGDLRNTPQKLKEVNPIWIAEIDGYNQAIDDMKRLNGEGV